MRSIHVPPDQLEVFHGESNEDEILPRYQAQVHQSLFRQILTTIRGKDQRIKIPWRIELQSAEELQVRKGQRT